MSGSTSNIPFLTKTLILFLLGISAFFILGCEDEILTMTTQERIRFDLNKIPLDPAQENPNQLRESVQKLMDNLTLMQLSGNVLLRDDNLYIFDPGQKILVKIGPEAETGKTEFKYILTTPVLYDQSMMGYENLPEEQRPIILKWNESDFVKTYPFDILGNFTVDSQENLYLENKYIETIDGEIGETSHYILNFNKDGEYATKIGRNGIEGISFLKNEYIKQLFCDENDLLYAVIAIDMENVVQLYQQEYSIICYVQGREYEIRKSGNDFRTRETPNNLHPSIENIAISPNGPNALFWVGFYKAKPVSHPESIPDISYNAYNYNIDHYKLYEYDIINDEQVEEVLSLRPDEKHSLFAFLGASNRNDYYFQSLDLQHNRPIFIIRNEQGDPIDNKERTLPYSSLDMPTFFYPYKGYIVQVVVRDQVLSCHEFHTVPENDQS